MERIQKILAQGGIASRRAAEQLIKAGRVRVNGHIVSELGAKADPRRDKVEVDGKRVIAEDLLYIVLHKPRGVVSTMSDPEGRPTVKELLASLGARVYPVGRLDFATSGVLLATNDGALADGLLHPRKTVPKTYVLKVNGEMKPGDLDEWRKGVRLEDGMTLPADAKLLRHEGGKTWVELTIKEGRNQQIRRMGEATRFPVMRLARVMFAGISAEGLAPGRWRHLTRDELVELKKTYGVPKSIPAVPVAPAPKPWATRSVPSARRGQAGRTQRAFGDEARPNEESPRARGGFRGGGDFQADAGEESRSRGRFRGGKEPRTGPAAGEPHARGDSRSGSDSRSGGDSRSSGDSRSGGDSRSRGRSRTGGGESRSGSRGESRSGSRGESRPRSGTGTGAGTGSSSRGARGSESRGARDGATPRPREDSPTKGARYGGGAPGRRSPNVTEDWGGGAGRGDSGRGRGHDDARAREPEQDPGAGGSRPRGGVGGGRFGRTRTTGTAGGIGSSEPAPRVKGRRGR